MCARVCAARCSSRLWAYAPSGLWQPEASLRWEHRAVSTQGEGGKEGETGVRQLYYPGQRFYQGDVSDNHFGLSDVYALVVSTSVPERSSSGEGFSSPSRACVYEVPFQVSLQPLPRWCRRRAGGTFGCVLRGKNQTRNV